MKDMKKYVKYWWLIILIMVGAGVSVKDYKDWRYEEMKNYGHGPDVVKPLELAKLYQNKIAGVRMRYPAAWEMVVGDKFKLMKPEETDLKKMIKVGERVEVVRFGEVKVSVELIFKNFPDVVNEEVKKIGVTLSREREYVVTMTGDIVVLTWESQGKVWQRAIVSREGRMIIVDVSKTQGEWRSVETTYWEMYKSLVLI